MICPKPTGVGLCAEFCSSDEECGPGQKCCSNGCGHACTDAIDCSVSVVITQVHDMPVFCKVRFQIYLNGLGRLGYRVKASFHELSL